MKPIFKKGWIILIAMMPLFVSAQKIFIDRPFQAGELTLFPAVNDEKTFYYLPDQPKLAYQDGKPQMMFMKFVENERSKPGEADNREADGGGIFHALVTFEVKDADRLEAEQILQEEYPEAHIEGPVIFTAGTVALISAVADGQGGHTKKVVGLGNAPLLEGGKAAVAFMLDKKGAQILWQTFQTPTPDISFSFEMEVSGYRSPTNGYIKGNFDKIYSSNEFGLGVRIPIYGVMLEVGVKAAFEEMRRKGIIEVYQEEGGKEFDEFLKIAYDQLAEMMFDRNDNNINALASLNKQGDVMERLDKLYNEVEKNQKKDKKNLDKKSQQEAESNPAGTERNEGPANPSEKTDDQGTQSTSTERQTEKTVNADKVANQENKEGSGDAQGAATEKTEHKTERPGEEPSQSVKKKIGNDPTPPADKDDQKDKKEKAPDNPPTPENTGKISNNLENKKGNDSNGKNFGPPVVAVTYQYRRVKQKGEFFINFNKVAAGRQILRFDENIGNVRSQCPQCFKEVNLYDPAFVQREILVMLDGYSTDDFGKYINFASVQMRKAHGNTQDVTFDDVRIDQKSFRQNENRFKMMYGWHNKSDNDRNRWLNYEYKPTWSFYGNYTLEGDWQPATANAIALSPPMELRRIRFEADPDLVKTNKIRMIAVKVYYDYGAGEMVQQITLKENTTLGEEVTIMLPKSKYEYQYEVMWQLWDNTRLTSGRKPTTDQWVFVDALPE